jgi:septal ring factor EnvC (AmiA/AmiB activator)
MIFTKAKLIMWGWRVAGLVTIVGGIWFAGQQFGLDKGFEKAYDRYKSDIESMNQEWISLVSDRDLTYQQQITNVYSMIEEEFNRYREAEQREKELRQQIAVLEGTLTELEREYENADFGTCDVTPDFDGLLHSAHKAATTRPD